MSCGGCRSRENDAADAHQAYVRACTERDELALTIKAMRLAAGASDDQTDEQVIGRIVKLRVS